MAGFQLPITQYTPAQLAEMARQAFKPPALMGGGGGGGNMQLPQSPGFNLGQGMAGMGQGLGALAGAFGNSVSSHTPAAGTQLGGGDAGGLTTVNPDGTYTVTGLEGSGGVTPTSATPVDPTGGGLSGFFGSLFGGARADGGPVTPGKYYTVGEQGPETFVPDVPGRIVPRDFFGGRVRR